jgi:hypothetical protein
MKTVSEFERRKAGADGRVIRLADGQHWMIATPLYSAAQGCLTHPLVDQSLDRIVDKIALNETCDIDDIRDVARALLKVNYDVTDDEVYNLFLFSSDHDTTILVRSVLEALFGPEDTLRTYTDWVRASLIANGLHSPSISTRDLPNILSILVATNRTVPLSQFADAHREVNESRTLEALI